VAFPVFCFVLVYHLIKDRHVSGFPRVHELRHCSRISRQPVDRVQQILLVLGVIHSIKDLRLITDCLETEHRFSSDLRFSVEVDIDSELFAESGHVERTRTERLSEIPRPEPFDLLQ
jgi:hypothetical protein